MTLAISLGLVNLFLYCAQQFGMALGVGAETVLLVAYVQTLRDGIVDDQEKKFARAVRGVRQLGLFLIIVSGAGVIGSQFLASGAAPVFSIIFLFKWSLIGIVLVLSIITSMSVWAELLQGLAAGTWYALFVVHILAPAGSWLTLGEVYGAWLLGFIILWTTLVFALRGKKNAPPILPKAPAAIAKPAVVIRPDTKKIWPFARQKTSTPALQPDVVITPAPVAVPAAAAATPVPIPAPPMPAPVTPVAAITTPVVTAAVPVVPPPPPAPLQPAAAPIPSMPTPPKPPAPSTASTKPAGAPEFIGLHVMPKNPNDIELRIQ
jgi:hypothetical protein